MEHTINVERPTIEELRLKFGDPAQSNDPRTFAFYSHKDGGLYMVLHSKVKDTTNGKTLVIYEHLWPFTGKDFPGARETYARPLEEWSSRFTWQRRETFQELMWMGDLHYWQEQVTRRKEARKEAEREEFRRLQRVAESATGGE